VLATSHVPDRHRLVDQCGDFEFAALQHSKPVQLVENWRYAVASSSLDRLEITHQVVSDAAEQRVAGSSRLMMNSWAIAFVAPSDGDE